MGKRVQTDCPISIKLGTQHDFISGCPESHVYGRNTFECFIFAKFKK